ncbi:hypothetical protein HWV62_36143 [Athelia sp. TMB]|nr:hypothetical protein HWV62_36143 [Athelia sp. TMB]
MSNAFSSSQDVHINASIRAIHDEAEEQLDVESFVDEPESSAEVVIEPRIRSVFFIFGCAQLLPWNELITATPYFLSRLAGSSYQSTFASYLSTSFTAVSFLVFIYTTSTSSQTSPAKRIYVASLTLAFLTFMLAMTTFMHTSRSFFVSFVLANSILQATANAYFQPAAIALASLFGPIAVQTVMSGQGAIGVIVSLIQVLSATASVWGTSPGTPSALAEDGAAEARSAFAFLGLSSIFLVGVTASFAWLTVQPAYKAVIDPFEHRQRRVRSLSASMSERVGLISGGPIAASETKGQIMRVAKANITYEIAVAYTLIVTLVRLSLHVRGDTISDV